MDGLIGDLGRFVRRHAAAFVAGAAAASVFHAIADYGAGFQQLTAIAPPAAPAHIVLASSQESSAPVSDMAATAPPPAEGANAAERDEAQSDEPADDFNKRIEQAAGNRARVAELAQRLMHEADPENGDLEIARRLPDEDRAEIARVLSLSGDPEVRLRATYLLFLAEDAGSGGTRDVLARVISAEADSRVLIAALDTASEYVFAAPEPGFLRAIEQRVQSGHQPDVRRTALRTLARSGRADSHMRVLINAHIRSHDKSDIMSGLEAARFAIESADEADVAALRAAFAADAERIAADPLQPSDLRVAALHLLENKQ
jgi:hypothetical protein